MTPFLTALIAQRDASLQQAGAFPCQCGGDLTCTACCVSAGLHDERTYWADLLAGEMASQWAEAAS